MGWFSFLKRVPKVPKVKVPKVPKVKVPKPPKVPSAWATKIKNLPVVRIIAGSAVGLVLLDIWTSAKDTLENWGIPEEWVPWIIGGVVVVVVILVLKMIFGRRK